MFRIYENGTEPDAATLREAPNDTTSGHFWPVFPRDYTLVGRSRFYPSKSKYRSVCVTAVSPCREVYPATSDSRLNLVFVGDVRYKKRSQYFNPRFSIGYTNLAAVGIPTPGVRLRVR